MRTPTLAPEPLERIDVYRRAANHLSVESAGRVLDSMLSEHQCEGYLLSVLNDLDRFPLVMEAVDRVPTADCKGGALKQQLQGKLIEHQRCIDRNGQDLPELRYWKWRS